MKSISAACAGIVLFAGVLSPLQAQTAATHCRIATFPDGSKHYWPILEFTRVDAESGSGNFYDIVADFVPSNSQIDDDDKMRIIAAATGATDMELAHTGTNGKRKARLTLKLDSSRLWAIGGAAPGTYAVFRLEDAAACQHDNADPAKPCKAFHFEYFLPGSSADLPELGRNVVPISDQVPCENEGAQDDEGDGHHGPD